MTIASQELRVRAVQAYKTGEFTQQQLADAYRVHYKTIQNWLKADTLGEPQVPKPRGHRQRILSKDEEFQVVELVRQDPSITLENIKAKLGKTCCLATIHRTLIRLGLTFKKKLYEHQNKIAKISNKTVKIGNNGCQHATQKISYL